VITVVIVLLLIAAAIVIVLLGGRSDDGSRIASRACIVYSEDYAINLGGLERLHPFDIHKYKRIYDALTDDGTLDPQQVVRPEPISEADILRVHTTQFLESLSDAQTVAEYLEAPPLNILPASVLDRGVLRAFRYATGGTLRAARESLAHGIAVNIGGGYHHAKPDSGEGFCVYADMPIAIRVLQGEGLIRKALIVDLDVHQGNGTAVCVRSYSSMARRRPDGSSCEAIATAPIRQPVP
jgi:histone deacetylase 11